MPDMVRKSAGVLLRGALLLALVFPLLLLAQEALPPDGSRPFDPIVEQMQFDAPTRIAGRLLTLDAYDEAIWVRWTHRYDRGRWLPMPSEMEFIVYPRDAEMMAWFRTLNPGAALRMTVQKGQDGKRRVIELDEM